MMHNSTDESLNNEDLLDENSYEKNNFTLDLDEEISSIPQMLSQSPSTLSTLEGNCNSESDSNENQFFHENQIAIAQMVDQAQDGLNNQYFEAIKNADLESTVLSDDDWNHIIDFNTELAKFEFKTCDICRERWFTKSIVKKI